MPSVDKLQQEVARLLDGNIRSLSRLITLIESTPNTPKLGMLEGMVTLLELQDLQEPAKVPFLLLWQPLLENLVELLPSSPVIPVALLQEGRF